MIWELRSNPIPAVVPALMMQGAEGAAALDDSAIAIAEAKAMRLVVEGLDAKLTRKLQQIDERLRRRDKAVNKARSHSSGIRSRPGQSVVTNAASSGADDVDAAIAGMANGM